MWCNVNVTIVSTELIFFTNGFMVKYHDGGDVDFTKGLMREQGLLKGLVCVCVCVCVCAFV